MKTFNKFIHWMSHPSKISRLKNFLASRNTHAYQKAEIKDGPNKEAAHLKPKDKPIILFSSCESSSSRGDLKYNGGMKVYSLWVKLLKQNGYEAYIVTYDGKCQPWLMEHQPCISLQQVKKLKEEGKHLKFVTGWLDSKAFIDLADKIYFQDCEAAYTDTIHSSVFSKLRKQGRICAFGTNSRFQQAWYTGKFGILPKVIWDWSDEQYWVADQTKRQEGLVGYMKEGKSSELEIEQIAEKCRQAGVSVRFVEIKGDEKEVLDLMQKCDFYLGLNPGKHPLLGEGCPRSQQEAMHAGCILLAYDVNGNREYLFDGYSGFLAPQKRPDILADRLIELARDNDLKEKIRKQSVEFISQNFTSRGKWPLLKEFLEL